MIGFGVHCTCFGVGVEGALLYLLTTKPLEEE
jgi:hypothetical protein